MDAPFEYNCFHLLSPPLVRHGVRLKPSHSQAPRKTATTISVRPNHSSTTGTLPDTGGETNSCCPQTPSLPWEIRENRGKKPTHRPHHYIHLSQLSTFFISKSSPDKRLQTYYRICNFRIYLISIRGALSGTSFPAHGRERFRGHHRGNIPREVATHT